MKTTTRKLANHINTIVIGAGQAGLATGYYLMKSGIDFLILDGNGRVGDTWRERWDSLRLFTPAQFDSLPGYPFPSPRRSFPAKDEVADYLEAYTARFSLPVRTGVKVSQLRWDDRFYEIVTSEGNYTCERVVVATGTNPKPCIPDFAGELDPSIHQLHSSTYRNPESLPAGDVLVVGAGTSGTEIAIELAKSRSTKLSGNPTFHIPDFIFRYVGSLYWWFANNLITVSTPIGLKAQKQIRGHGAPLINISVKDVDASGVMRFPRLSGVKNGLPVTDDGRELHVDVIIWCTGFKPDFSWITFDVTGESGWPLTNRGVSSLKGLYFVGMLFQYGLTSGLIGGVGRDAAYVVKHLQRTA